MLIHVIRFMFLVIIVSFMFNSITAGVANKDFENGMVFYLFVGGVSIAILVLLIDWLTPKKVLSSLAGIFFGLLIGLIFSWALSYVVDMVDEVFYLDLTQSALKMVKWLIGLSVCYMSISLVVRTKDDKRFIIPYVEFSRQTKGLRPLVLDSSVIVDGRIADLSQTKIFDAPLVVPRFILNELQLLSDSSDKLKRTRGRRGLDLLNSLRKDPLLEVQIDDTPPPGIEDRAPVDQKLVAFTKNCDGRLVTTDYNLGKVAILREVDVVNINDIAKSLKPVVLPGEFMEVTIIKQGEESSQGIGYLDDGTMVVAEGGRDYIAKSIMLEITSSLQTSAGRMIFGKFAGLAGSSVTAASPSRNESTPAQNDRGNNNYRDGRNYNQNKRYNSRG